MQQKKTPDFTILLIGIIVLIAVMSSSCSRNGYGCHGRGTIINPKLKKMKSNFYIPNDFKNPNNGKGIQLTFENGWTISIMFGYGNYCENRDKDRPQTGGTTCRDAEIAIWDNNGKWHEFENGDTVNGYLDTDNVAKWIEFTKNQI